MAAGTGNSTAHQFAESVKVLAGASLLDAARYYIRRHPTKLPRKTVQDVVEEFIRSRREAKRSEEYVGDLEYRLGRFVKAFQTCMLTAALCISGGRAFQKTDLRPTTAEPKGLLDAGPHEPNLAKDGLDPNESSLNRAT
jgi:hypothetical protein